MHEGDALPALDAVLAVLRCPACAASLTRSGRTLGCVAGHRFDVARQGYVSLLPGRRGAAVGDDASMVAARQAFLGAGHYAPLTAALCDAVPAVGAGPGDLVVDVGAGTGQHLAAVVEACGAAGLALDASTPALRRAARCHPRVAAVGADVWGRLPLADGAARVLLDVFSPRNPAEFGRVLASRGHLLVVVPRPDHLAELVAAAGLIAVDGDKDQRLADQLGGRFQSAGEHDLTWPLKLDAEAAATLVAMTPSARHVDLAEVRERLGSRGEPLAVTASVRLVTFRAR